MLVPPDRQHVVFLGGPGISYVEHLPPPELAPWVAVAWQIRSAVSFEFRILPDGCMDLIGDDVVGSFSQAATASFEPGDVFSGIRLHPGAFPALTGVPASELLDLRVPLAEVVPGFRSLRRLAAEAPVPDPLAEAAVAARDVRSLARESGYSERHLRRRVVTATGHGPKRLSRIARMQALLRAGRRESWARTAIEYGYYDEAHMANDVRALAGATPHALVT